MADGDELLQSEDPLYSSSQIEDQPILESHDPESGIGTFRMPDRSTMEVHLPSAGIIPHESVPVTRPGTGVRTPAVIRPSHVGARVPVTERQDFVTDPSRASAPVVVAPPVVQAPLMTPEQQAERSAADRASRESRRIYREETIPAWRSRHEREALADITLDPIADAARRREQATLAERARIEEEHGRVADRAESARVRAAATGFQDAQIEDYYRQQAEDQAREQAEMQGITAAPTSPLQPDTRTAETTVTPGSVGITRNPDGTEIFTDAEGNEISRRQAFADGMVASPTTPEFQGTGERPGQGTTINPDGSYVYTDERGDQYSFTVDGEPIDFREAGTSAPDSVVARAIGDTGPSTARQVPVDTRTEMARRRALMDRVEGRTIPSDESALASMAYGQSEEPTEQISRGPMFSPGPRPVVGPTLEQARGPARPQIAGVPRGAVAGGRPRVTRIPVPTLTEDERLIQDLTNRPRAGTTPQRGARVPGAISDRGIETLAGQSPNREPDLVDRQYNVEAKRGQIASDSARMQLQVEQEAQRQRRELEDQRQRAVMQAQRNYQNAIDRVAEARVDPTRFFRERGAPGYIGSAISVALGAMGNVYTGGTRNLALEQINRAVDLDIAAQENGIQNLRSAAGEQGNMVGIMRQEFSDRQAAQDATRAGMLQQAALQIQGREADLQDAQAQNAATQLRQQIEQQAEEARQSAIVRQSEVDLRTAQSQRALAGAEHDMAMAEYQGLRNQQLAYRMQHPSGPPAPDRTTATQFDAFQRAVETGANPMDAAHATFDPGSFFYNNPPQHAPIDGVERRALETLNSALNQVERDLPSDALEDIPGYGRTGAFPHYLLSEAGQNLRQDMQNLRDAFARDRTGANMSDREAEDFDSILGMSTTSTDQELRHGLDLMRQMIADHLSRSADTLGLTDRDVADLAPGAREITGEERDSGPRGRVRTVSPSFSFYDTSDQDVDSRVD